MAMNSRMGGPGRPSKDNRVGYKRPPVEHQFKKGEPSPNRYGRRGKPKEDPFVEEKDFLDEKIWITENGKRLRITRDELIDRQLFALAAKGDVQASKRLDERIERRRLREAERRNLKSVAQATLYQDASIDAAIVAKALARQEKKGRATGKSHE